ncbi:MAG: NAD-dependent epimerase/dehydratase family protein, partial [Pseudomonadota bacterium]
YFNVAGADPEAEIGEHHEPETHLIPIMLDAVAGDRPELTVYGDDYDTPDGTCIRDYLHVMDLADAHVLGVKHLLGGGAPLTLNLGTGSGFSVKEVIDAARAVTNKAVPHRVGPRRPGDPPKLVSGSTEAEKALGWRLERSNMRDIIADAWRWRATGLYKE